MPLTCKTHQNAISGITKDCVNKPYEWNGAIRDHAKNKLTSRGLEISDKNMNAIAAALQAKDNYVPKVETVDAEVEKLKTLSDSIWASSSQKDAELSPNPADTYNKTVAAPEKRATVPALPRLEEVRPSKGAEIITNKASTAPVSVAEEAVPSTMTKPTHVAARKIAVPFAKRTPKKNTPRETEVPNCAVASNASRTQPPPASISGTAECHNHSSGGAPTGTTPINPPEIEALLEAERKRAANTLARLEIGSTVLKTLESVILSMKTIDNKEYLDAMNVCLRGALARFLRTGTTPVPTSLAPPPHRPAGQQQRALTTIDHQDSKSCRCGAPGHFNLGNCSPERATQTANASDDKSCPENADSADQEIGQDAPFVHAGQPTVCDAPTFQWPRGRRFNSW